MTTSESTTPKKVVRRRKSIPVLATTSESITPSVAKLTPITQSFSELLTLIENAKNEFEQLQKEIAVKVIESGSASVNSPQPQLDK